MRALFKYDILWLHRKLIDDTGGSHGLRDENLLDSALNAPFSSFGGIDLFSTLLERVARLGFGLVSNHPFIDGNKRIGLMIMQVTLHWNGITLNCTNDELVQLGLGIASGKLGYKEILGWLVSHSK